MMIVETTTQRAMKRLSELAAKTFSDRVVFRVDIDSSGPDLLILSAVDRDGDDFAVSYRFRVERVNGQPDVVIAYSLANMAEELGRRAFLRR